MKKYTRLPETLQLYIDDLHENYLFNIEATSVERLLSMYDNHMKLLKKQAAIRQMGKNLLKKLGKLEDKLEQDTDYITQFENPITQYKHDDTVNENFVKEAQSISPYRIGSEFSYPDRRRPFGSGNPGLLQKQPQKSQTQTTKNEGKSSGTQPQHQGSSPNEQGSTRYQERTNPRDIPPPWPWVQPQPQRPPVPPSTSFPDRQFMEQLERRAEELVRRQPGGQSEEQPEERTKNEITSPHRNYTNTIWSQYSDEGPRIPPIRLPLQDSQDSAILGQKLFHWPQELFSGIQSLFSKGQSEEQSGTQPKEQTEGQTKIETLFPNQLLFDQLRRSVSKIQTMLPKRQPEGQFEEQSGKQREGQSEGQPGEQIGRQSERQTGGQAGGQTGGQVGGQAGGQLEGQPGGQPEEQSEGETSPSNQNLSISPEIRTRIEQASWELPEILDDRKFREYAAKFGNLKYLVDNGDLEKVRKADPGLATGLELLIDPSKYDPNNQDHINALARVLLYSSYSSFNSRAVDPMDFEAFKDNLSKTIETVFRDNVIDREDMGIAFNRFLEEQAARGVTYEKPQDAFSSFMSWVSDPNVSPWYKFALAIGAPLLLGGLLAAATSEKPTVGLVMALLGLAGVGYGVYGFMQRPTFQVDKIEPPPEETESSSGETTPSSGGTTPSAGGETKEQTPPPEGVNPDVWNKLMKNAKQRKQISSFVNDVTLAKALSQVTDTRVRDSLLNVTDSTDIRILFDFLANSTLDAESRFIVLDTMMQNGLMDYLIATSEKGGFAGARASEILELYNKVQQSKDNPEERLRAINDFSAELSKAVKWKYPWYFWKAPIGNALGVLLQKPKSER